MTQVPITTDVAAAVGPFGEGVENRSLLLDKFVFHKLWPVEHDDRGRVIKWDDATRWSFMRLTDQAQLLLMAESVKLDKEAGGRNISPDNAQKKRGQAAVARRLANVKWDGRLMEEWRARHSRNFIAMLQRALPNRHLVLVGQLEGRMAINLSDSLVQNAGIALDRLFGMPYIPGSAVKGVSRHAALAELKAAADIAERRRLLQLFQQVFGTAGEDFNRNGQLKQYASLVENEQSLTVKGQVDFLAAHPVSAAKITVDITTVHYPAYYRSGSIEDLANEKPTINSFPVVEQGARFAFCLVASRLASDPEKVMEAAGRWLKSALTQEGLGAKTSNGYGWFSLPQDGLRQLEEAEQREAEARAAEKQKELERAEIEALIKKERAEEEERIRQKRAVEARRKEMTPEAIADEEVLGWNDDAFHARLRSFVKTKGAPSDELKQAMVRSLRENRISLWNEWKLKAVRGNEAKIADAIRALSKKMNLGKMP